MQPQPGDSPSTDRRPLRLGLGSWAAAQPRRLASSAHLGQPARRLAPHLVCFEEGHELLHVIRLQLEVPPVHTQGRLAGHALGAHEALQAAANSQRRRAVGASPDGLRLRQADAAGSDATDCSTRAPLV